MKPIDRRSGFSLVEILINMGLVLMALLGLASLVIYNLRASQHAGVTSRAMQYARQTVELIRLNNWAVESQRPSGLVDTEDPDSTRPPLSASTRTLNAAPLTGYGAAADNLWRYIRITPLTSTSTDYRSRLWRIEVEILFFARPSGLDTLTSLNIPGTVNRERSVTLATLYRQ